MINISLNVEQNCHCQKKTSNLPIANNEDQNEANLLNFQTGSIQIDTHENIDPTETLINNLNKEYLNDIKNVLERIDTVIYGDSGTGKLTLALKAAQRYLNQNKKNKYI